jgi:hypothetical protein
MRPTVREMLNMGEKYFDEQGVPKEERRSVILSLLTKVVFGMMSSRFGFHVPPMVFINHLHLHCLALPLNGRMGEFLFSVAEPKGPDYLKGWGWFAEVHQVINILEKGETVWLSAVNDPLPSPRL